MKRRIINLGHAQGITVPSIWARAHNLEKGEIVEIEEHNSSLLINLNREDNSETEIDLIGLKKDLIWRHLIAAYRKGTKTVIIGFNGKEELETIQQLVKDLLGMVIIKQNKNKLIMKDMFDNDKNIDSSLEKIFTLLLDLSRDSFEAVKNKDSLSLGNIKYQDFNINKFANLCLRLLNMNKEMYRDNAYSLYKIISLLEEIGDEYRRLSLVYSRLDKKVSKNSLESFKNVNDLLESFYRLYYSFNKEKLKEFYSKADETLKKLKESYENGNSVDIQILSSLDTILHLIKNLSEENMVVKL